ncbi:MAG: hypothetical protein KDD92_06245 [Caldilineaceae bacterium]|nr:hypothetical protein [Caldilineaceae bacterium]
MSSNDRTFQIIILIGRPASGKSEIIDFLMRCPPRERRDRYHAGELGFIDDFPMLWTWFEEDAILAEKLGEPRVHTDADGYFLHEYQWHLLIERIDLEYRKLLRDRPDYYARHTTIVEFARGTEHGGYAAAFPHLSPDLLRQAAILYVDVPFEESLRKNRRRFNPDRPDSILEHGLPDEKLRRLYGGTDWFELTAGDPEFLIIHDVRVPYVVFDNHDDVTTDKPAQLAARLEETLARLWRIRQSRQ